MKTNVYNAYIKNGEFFFGVIGTVEYESKISAEDMAESVYDLTNWSCWAGVTFDEIKTSGIQRDGFTYTPNDKDRGFANDDIMLCIDEKWWVAESFGWVQFDSFIDAMTHLVKNADWVCNKLDNLK